MYSLAEKQKRVYGNPSKGGLKGGPARAAALSPERRSEIAKQANLARALKHRKQLQSLVGPAIDALQHALKIANDDPSALIKVVTAILDRTGFHAKSTVELEGEIDHTGEIVHRHQLLDVDRIPLIVKRMMVASLDSDWVPSEELQQRIREELPMLQVKVEVNKK